MKRTIPALLLAALLLSTGGCVVANAYAIPRLRVDPYHAARGAGAATNHCPAPAMPGHGMTCPATTTKGGDDE